MARKFHTWSPLKVKQQCEPYWSLLFSSCCTFQKNEYAVWIGNGYTKVGKKGCRSSQRMEYVVHIYRCPSFLSRQEVTTRLPLFTVRCRILHRHQLIGFGTFWTLTTLPKFVLRFLIPLCHVICWHSRGFFYFVARAESKAWCPHWVSLALSHIA